MDFKKIGLALLYPPTWLMILLVPVSVGAMIPSMIFLGTESVISIITYVLSAYTLTVWCFKIPDLIKLFGNFKSTNKYAVLWRSDERLRVNVSLYSSLLLNVVYALLQLWLGVWHNTFWFYSLAGYYLSLAVMRFYLVRYTAKNKAGEDMRSELLRYRACGWVFLFMNLALSLIIFFMVYWNRTFVHHEITTIAMAAYTFTAFTLAIIGIVKYRKYNSPVYSAVKAISLASATVSILTLESTMLTTFGAGTMSATARKLFLGLSGGVISAFVLAMAVYMIVESTKKIKLLTSEEKINGE